MTDLAYPCTSGAMSGCEDAVQAETDKQPCKQELVGTNSRAPAQYHSRREQRKRAEEQTSMSS